MINTTAGKEFSVDVSASDNRDGEDLVPEYIFSEGAVDANGYLLEGEHTCTLKYTDYAGNSSELVLSLKVGPQDVTAPVISWAPDKIYANDGMRPVINVIATDDHDDDVEVTLVWSEGALYKGKLCNGNHTLTITAVDETGNKTEKVIPVIVESGLPSID